MVLQVHAEMCFYSYYYFETCKHYGIEVEYYCQRCIFFGGLIGSLVLCRFVISRSKALRLPISTQDAELTLRRPVALFPYPIEQPKARGCGRQSGLVAEEGSWRHIMGFCRTCVETYKAGPNALITFDLDMRLQNLVLYPV